MNSMVLPINPILLDFPDFFETERLRVQAPRLSDVKPLNAAINQSLAVLKPWMAWAQAPHPLEQTELYVRQHMAKWLLRENLAMTIWRKSDEKLIGAIGMHRMDWLVPTAEVGYWLHQDLHGQGYITEAAGGILKFGFEEIGFHRMEIWCDADNTRSAAVAQRLGFRLDGRLREYGLKPDGSRCDLLLYSMLAGEYL